MRRRRPLLLASTAVLAALSLLAAGCGGSGGAPGVANVTSSTSTTTTRTTGIQGALVAFSSCMRSHGIANFPDPQHYQGGSVKLSVAGLDKTPQVHAAVDACGHLLPRRGSEPQLSPQQQRVQLDDERSFASCMRARGVARFPDPNAQGELSVAMVQAQGIDVHSPQVLHVVQECLPASHGALTPAKVREALSNAGG